MTIAWGQQTVDRQGKNRRWTNSVCVGQQWWHCKRWKGANQKFQFQKPFKILWIQKTMQQCFWNGQLTIRAGHAIGTLPPLANKIGALFTSVFAYLIWRSWSSELAFWHQKLGVFFFCVSVTTHLIHLVSNKHKMQVDQCYVGVMFLTVFIIWSMADQSVITILL